MRKKLIPLLSLSLYGFRSWGQQCLVNTPRPGRNGYDRAVNRDAQETRKRFPIIGGRRCVSSRTIISTLRRDTAKRRACISYIDRETWIEAKKEKRKKNRGGQKSRRTRCRVVVTTLYSDNLRIWIRLLSVETCIFL